MELELHIWPALGSARSLDAESLAISVLVQDLDIPVVASGNVFVSSRRHLPALVGPGVDVSGFSEIASYLADNGMMAPMVPEDVALQAYIAEYISPLTLWTLFGYDTNWTGFTRSAISRAYQFPMQYNVALKLHRNATSVVQRYGLGKKNSGGRENSKLEARDVGDNASMHPPAVGKLHQQLIDESVTRSDILKLPKQVMTALTRARKAYSVVRPAVANLKPAKSDERIPSLVLLGAHIVLQTLPELPERPLESAIDDYRVLLTLSEAVQEAAVFQLADSPCKALTLPNYLVSFTPWTTWR